MKHLSQAVFLVATGLVYANITIAGDTAPAKTNFGDPRYNVINDFGAYGDDFRWPASDKTPRPTQEIIAYDEPDPAQNEDVPNINFYDAQFNGADDLGDYGEDYRWPVSDGESDTDGKDLAGVNE